MKLKQSGRGPWPEGRVSHAACCLNYGQQYPQLLVYGGLNIMGKALEDVWILAVERGNWRKVRYSLLDEHVRTVEQLVQYLVWCKNHPICLLSYVMRSSTCTNHPQQYIHTSYMTRCCHFNSPNYVHACKIK